MNVTIHKLNSYFSRSLLDKYKINFTESTEQPKNINTRALVFKASETV